MATLTHAQYNSPLSLYSRDNVQEVVNQVTAYPRPNSAMSGTFDPNQSQVYRYLQSSGQLPTAHSARYDEASSEYPRYRGYVDPNVQSPSFKRLQYVTGSGGVESRVEEGGAQEVHPPPQTHTEDIRSTRTIQQQSQPAQAQTQPIALGYAPVGNEQQRQYQQQQYYQQHTQWGDQGPPVAQRDPADTERDHPLDSTFAARIAEAERPKVPPPVVPSWARFAERKQERWQHSGQTDQQQQQQRASTPQPATNPVQYYRPPPQTQYNQQQWAFDSSRTAHDKWQTHYAPYRFESGATATSAERPRSRSVEPSYGGRTRYGGGKEWLKPFIAPNLRWQYGEGPPPSRPVFSPISLGRTYTTTSRQDYGQSGVGTGPYYGSQTQNYDFSTSSQSRPRQEVSNGSTYSPLQQQSGTSHEYVSTTSRGGPEFGGGRGAAGTPSWTKDSQYSRSVYENRSQQSGSQQQQVTPYDYSNTQSQALWQSEQEARRQRQVMEEELRKRATTAGQSIASTGAVTATDQWRNRPVPSENRVTTYTTTGTGQKWQQAPGSETKTQSTGSYLDPQGNKVTFTKEVYTSSDPGKEFSMLTEQERKILEEPLQPGVISRHITTKYYKKSTFTSSTTTSTSQTPPVTTTTRQAIQAGPSANAIGSRQF